MSALWAASISAAYIQLPGRCRTGAEKAVASTQNMWTADPHCYTGGRWRYVVLKTGQSVFFMPGTIHFCFPAVRASDVGS
ncbi:hypothetical protein B0T25DRAFT_548684 [Lasiosphaeria hispida]|uniref:Uncharacterized protein n=1 Tax=Lasiosphaeria hispida TaxID=260671 RepID=A0AAJ0HF21_9PEZI|nr:hypothetical protein B0T25DRAFT_548684 [Lasiosphaeria hispida]